MNYQTEAIRAIEARQSMVMALFQEYVMQRLGKGENEA